MYDLKKLLDTLYVKKNFHESELESADSDMQKNLHHLFICDLNDLIVRALESNQS